ncbi:MAG: hypothetical protein C0618_03595 [Desulfuromonas sp.]|nr:MAG: hypothetical protein C0618_03595 [Desulfuromonas sp.]
MAKRLGDILIEKYLITTEQLEEATEIQCLYGGKLGTSLIEVGAIDEDKLGFVLSEALHLPYFKPSLLMQISADLISLVPRQLALKHMVVPCKLQGKRLFLAMAEPNDLSAIDDLSFHLGYSIAPVVVPELRLSLALNKYYKRKLSPRLITLGRQLMTGGPQARTDANARQTEGEEPISGLQEYRADVLEKGAVRSVADLETILDTADVAEDAPHPEAKRDEAWPMLGDQGSGTDTLSDSEYQELTTLGTQQQPDNETEVEIDIDIVEEPTSPREFLSFCQQISKADNRDDIATCLIDYLAQEFAAGGILMVKGHQVMGWKATIGTTPVIDFDRFHVHLDQPSVLLTVAESKSYYLGPLVETPVNQQLTKKFGDQLPATVLLIPILLRGRLVSIVYLQDDIALMTEKLAELQRLVSKSSMGLEMLVLKNKILMS